MFIGMALNLVFHVIRTRNSNVAADSLKEPLTDSATPRLSARQKFLYVSIPAMFDLVTTGLNYVGLLYCSASVWQMLRGANIIFSALFSVVFLGRKFKAFNWFGVCVVVFGIFLVGLSNYLSSRATSDDENVPTVDVSLQIFGMSMVILAQVFSGGQVITEEKLLKGLQVPPLILVGYEGIWGMIVCLLLVIPVTYMIPGSDAGSYENTYDTLLMLTNSSSLIWMVLLYAVSCTSYNLCAVCVTGSLSAVHRTMFMASRTMIVWMVDLYVHYYVDSSIAYGEKWTVYSYLQLGGFFVLVTGQAIYAGLIKIPGFQYTEASPVLKCASSFSSPASMKNMSPGFNMQDEQALGQDEIE